MEDRSKPIAVVYLARFAEGIPALQRFADSYRRFPAGHGHDLVVLYKGFDQGRDLEQARHVFSGLPHIGLELDDSGFDIGSYLQASRRISHRHMLLVNTYTEFAAPGWLARLAAHASREGVGLVGAMGSYESLYDSFALIQTTIWLCNYFKISYDESLHEYYRFIIDLYCKDWSANARFRERCKGAATGFLTSAIDQLHRQAALVLLRAGWWELTRRNRVFADYNRFPGFPNPHVRSNGFLVPRERLLQSDPGDIRTKYDACAFESGFDSLTTRVRREGGSAVLVDRQGRGYDVHEWWRGRLFRVDDQADLLLADNQSRAFAQMDAQTRAVHARMTWGDFLPATRDVLPSLGFRFGKKSLSPAELPWLRRWRA